MLQWFMIHFYGKNIIIVITSYFPRISELTEEIGGYGICIKDL